MENSKIRSREEIENRIYQESCLDTLRAMPDGVIDCVITSPPYWQLRDYGYDGQWGLEPTYQEYLEHLWSLMDALYSKLKDEGTVWINLGDTYARGSRGKDGTNHTVIKKSKEHHIEPLTKPDYGDLNKCLLMIPHRFAIGCIDNGWIVRNDIIWAKTNGMPESVTDRFSKKHEYMFFMVKNEKYYFDLDAIRDSYKQSSIERSKRGVSENNKWVNGVDGKTPHNLSQPRANITTKIPKEQADMFSIPRARQYKTKNIAGSMTKDGLTRTTAGLSLKSADDKINPFGKNPGDVSDFWDIPTRPNHSKHYATYSDELIRKPILAGCPEGGIIYDPFMGTGSTAEAAIRSGRKFIGSEMSEEYVKIANKRLNPLLMQLNLF